MKTLSTLLLLLVCTAVFAQKQFVVQGGGNTQTFTDINAAISAASSGDTLFVPGGGFALSPVTVDKTLHWRGVGFYPDSTQATGASVITSGATFTGNCDGSTFEGIQFNNSVSFGSNGNEATGIRIKRCRFYNLYLRYSTSGSPNLDFYCSESLISTNIDGRNGAGCVFENCLMFCRINGFNQSIFNFNVVSWYASNSYNRVINYCHNCRFINNVFAAWHALYRSSNCNFKNNLFAGALPYDSAISTFTGSGNMVEVGSANIFKSISGEVHQFSYDNDYTLKADCVGVVAATDGTDVGAFGGNSPYKTAAVPYYPHIRSVSIDDEATNGELGVQIGVSAQDR